jgi:hypothetical protein
MGFYLITKPFSQESLSALCFLWSLWTLWRCLSAERNRPLWSSLFILSVALSFQVGFLGPLYLLSGLISWGFADRIRKRRWTKIGVLVGRGFALGLFLIFLSAAQTPQAWLKEELLYSFLWSPQEGTRLAYLPVILFGFLPFFPQLLLSSEKGWSSLQIFLLSFILGPFLLLSFVGPKVDTFLLPMFPMIALFVSLRISIRKAASAFMISGFLYQVSSAALPNLSNSRWLGPALPFGWVLIAIGAALLTISLWRSSHRPQQDIY